MFLLNRSQAKHRPGGGNLHRTVFQLWWLQTVIPWMINEWSPSHKKEEEEESCQNIVFKKENSPDYLVVNICGAAFFWFQSGLNHCCKKYKRASKHTDQSSRNRVVGTGKARSHLHASASLSDVDVRMCASSSTAAGHWNLSRWCLQAGGSDVRLCDDKEKPGSGPSSTIKVDYDDQYSSCSIHDGMAEI